MSIDLDLARERFESSTDFTIGLEEEFAILDPATLELEHRFEQLYAACQKTTCWPGSAAGELIASEIEIRSGRAETFAAAEEAQRERRLRLFELVDGMGLALAAMGTHPWAATWTSGSRHPPLQPAARRTRLGRAAQQHLEPARAHGGARRRPGDRRLRPAARAAAAAARASANSPFLDRRDSGLHTVRTEIFTRTFPRCGVPSPFVDWGSYAEFVALLQRTGSVVESTQLWWSVRPHHAFGTVEVRICDAQTRGEESFAWRA